MARKSDWIQKTLTYCGVEYAYRVVTHHPDLRMNVVLKTHVPRGFYHSFLNDAIKEAEEDYNLTHSI